MMRPSLGAVLAAVSCALVLAALFMVFAYVPTEASQGIVQRIFYFHVPCAWLAFLSFGLSAVAGAFYLAFAQQVWDDIGYAAAEVGMLFCTLVLITGSLWAKPIWGTWWTWDSRLTTTFILWLLYIGYLMLRAMGEDNEQVARLAAVVAIVAVLDIPLIVISVRLWRTIHPAVLVTPAGEHGLEDPRMMETLAVSTLAVSALFAWLFWLRLKTLRVKSRLFELRRTLVAVQAIKDVTS
jgi:heme exporter protein C